VPNVGALRDRIRARRTGRLLYRVVIGVVGTAVVAGGLALVPLPGPGWLIVFIGLAILASEFEWAHRLLTRARELLAAWTDWLGRQPLWVRGAVGLATFAFVAGVVYGLAVWRGVPSWVPAGLIPPLPGL
jgi:uncharacterized protein (TIGR02611 family)